MGPGDAAMLIHSDRIHILIDLNGYSNGSKTEIFGKFLSCIFLLYFIII